MGCSCCGSRDLTTGGCIHCMSTISCGTCGERFCATHRQETYSKHLEACPGILRIGEAILPQTHEWRER